MADISISQLEQLRKQYSIEPDAGVDRASDKFNAFEEQGIDIKTPVEKFLLALEVERLTNLYRESNEDHNETLKTLEDLIHAARDDKSQKIDQPETPEERVVIDRNSVEVMFENINIEGLINNFGEQGKHSQVTAGIHFLLSIEIDRLTMVNQELKTQVMELEKKVGLDESQNLSSDRHSVVYRYMEELESKVGNLEDVKKENEALIVSMDSELREYKKEIEHLLEDRERLESMTSMLAYKQQSTTEERDELASELADLRMEFSNLKQKHEELQKESEELQKDLENIKPPPNFPGSPVHRRGESNLVNSQLYSETDCNVDHQSKENSSTQFRESLKLITESGFLDDGSKRSLENPNGNIGSVHRERIAELEELLQEKVEQITKLDNLLSVPKADKSMMASKIATMINKSMLARSTVSTHPYKVSAGTSAVNIADVKDTPAMLDKSVTVEYSESPVKLESEIRIRDDMEKQISSQAHSLDTMCKNIMNLQQEIENKEVEIESCLEELSKATSALVEHQAKIQELEASLADQKQQVTAYAAAKSNKSSIGIQTVDANMNKVLQDEINRLRANQVDLDKMKDQIKKLNKDKRDSDSEMESWKFETEVLKKSIEENAGVFKKKDKEIGVLKKKLDEFSQKLKSEGLIKNDEIRDLTAKLSELEKRLKKQENSKFNNMLLNHSEVIHESPRGKDLPKQPDPDSGIQDSLVMSIIQINNTLMNMSNLSPSSVADTNAVYDKHAAIVNEIGKNIFASKLPPSAARVERLEKKMQDAKSEAESYRLKYESSQMLLNAYEGFDVKKCDTVYRLLYEQEKRSVKLLQDEIKKFDRIGRQKDEFIDQMMARSLKFYDEIENHYKIKESYQKMMSEPKIESMRDIRRRNTIQGYSKRGSERDIGVGLQNKRNFNIPTPDDFIGGGVYGMTTTNKSKYLPPKCIIRSVNPSKVNLHDDFILL